MSLKTIFWTGYCNKERIVATYEIEKIVNNYGYITDFKQYSDLSIMLKIELEELKIAPLHRALGRYISMNDTETPDSASEAERVIFLNLTFTCGTGDLRIETPAVPG